MKSILALLVTLPLFILGCDDESNSKSGSARPAPGEPIAIAGLKFDLPSDWVVEEPKSLSPVIPRLAQVRLPRTEGEADDGQLIALHAMGSVEANIERWKKQFAGGAAPAAPEVFEVDGLRCTVVDISGTFSVPPFARKEGQPSSRENQRMIGAILQSPERLTFFKATGSIDTIGKHRDAILAFLKSGRR